MIARPKRTTHLVVATVVVFVVVAFLTSNRLRHPSGPTTLKPEKSRYSTGDNGQSAIFNSTLGFEKVFAVGLPSRSDKRDALTLMASLTGFKLSWIDGVLGKAIPDKALPYGWNRKEMLDSNLGSWRGHINAMRQMVDEGLSSALIMEDDMDWDVHLKTQLSQFALLAKDLQKGFHQTQTLSSPSPYGQNWDMLWVGSCETTFDEHLPENLQIPESERDDRQLLIRNDPTVPTWNHARGNLSFSWEDYPPQTRVVYVPGDNICSFAYALSASGAQKALQYLGIEGQHKPYDNHLSDLCRLRANGMRCVSIVPSLFVHHRPKGYVSADSDIQNGGAEGKEEQLREVGFTDNVLYSTRLNLKNLVTGLEPEKQWVD